MRSPQPVPFVQLYLPQSNTETALSKFCISCLLVASTKLLQIHLQLSSLFGKVMNQIILIELPSGLLFAERNCVVICGSLSD